LSVAARFARLSRASKAASAASMPDFIERWMPLMRSGLRNDAESPTSIAPSV
jgi:hypothetical protein